MIPKSFSFNSQLISTDPPHVSTHSTNSALPLVPGADFIPNNGLALETTHTVFPHPTNLSNQMNENENVLAVSIPELPTARRTSSVPFHTKRCSKVKPSSHDGEDHARRWRKDYHNAIEKRRRDQMNSYIEDLQEFLLKEKAAVPNCDKIMTLSAAIDYLRSYRPQMSDSFSVSAFTKTEFTNIFAELDRTFALTFRCSDFKILCVNEGVTAVLGVPPSLLVGQKLINFINPEDVEDFKLEHSERLTKLIGFTSQHGEAYSTNFVVNMIANYLNTGSYNLLPILFSGEFKIHSLPNPDSVDDNAGALCFSGALKSLI